MLFQGIFPYPSIPGTAYEVTLENRKVAITSIMDWLFNNFRSRRKPEEFVQYNAHLIPPIPSCLGVSFAPLTVGKRL